MTERLVARHYLPEHTVIAPDAEISFADAVVRGIDHAKIIRVDVVEGGKAYDITIEIED